MRQIIWTVLGGCLFAELAAAQEPPAPPPAGFRGRAGRAGGPLQPPGDGDSLPPGAVARLGTPLRSDRFSPSIRNASTLAYSPDGRLVAAADTEIRLWEPATGREIRTLTVQAAVGPAAAGFAGVVPPEMLRPMAVAFSPDGQSIAAINTTQVTVWETATGKQVAAWPLTGPSRVMSGSVGFAYTTDGKALVAIVYNTQMVRAAAPAGGGPGVLTRGLNLNFWDAATGKELRQVPLGDVPTIPSTALAMSPDGRTLAAAVAGQSIHIIELATGKVREELSTERPAARGRGRGAPVSVTRDPHSLRFAPDGRTLYTVASEGEIVAHDLVTGQERRFGAALAGSQLHISADGKSLVVRGADGSVRIYDTASGRLRHRLGDASAYARAGMVPFALSPDGASVALQDGAGVRFIDVATGRDRGSSAGHTAAIAAVQFSPDGRTLISSGADQVITWDVGRRAVAVARPADEDRVRARAISPDANWMAEALFDGRLRLTEVPSGRARELEAGKRLGSLAFAPDGGTLVAAELVPLQSDAEPRPIRRWDLKTGAPQPPLDPGAAATHRLFFSPDGRRLVGTDSGGGARVWEWPSGKLLWQAPPRGGLMIGVAPAGVLLGIGPAAYSPDGRKLVLASPQGPLRIFDAATGQSAGELEGHGGQTHAVAFAPDGRTLATGGSDGLVRVWDIETGSSIHHMAGHTGGVTALAYSPDGTLLASGGVDATIILWDATKLGRPTGPATVTSPELTADQVKKCWDDLAAPDAKVAYKAVRALAASPAVSVPRLQEWLTPIPAPDAPRVAELLADLDHNLYSRRQKASEALAALGTAVRSVLQQHRATASPEARQRIDDLLQRINQTEWTPEMLRQSRGVEALERAGTPEARAVLEKLGQGAADALLTREARAAIARMRE